MKKEIWLFSTMLTIANSAQAQHENHMHAKETLKTEETIHDTSLHTLHLNPEDTIRLGNMSHAFSLHLPMTRNGSGTGWLPDASPMYGSMLHSKKWMYMLHYNLFLRYTNQDFLNKGTRGDDTFDAPNWLMFMGQRRLGRNGLFHFSSMFSLDPITEGGDGYPLLFQSGETYNGEPLVDRQHPHDLFSELSIGYTHSLSTKADAFIYIAYPGEPALGAIAFMHRPSALNNPDAPLSHHWVDATHITFGVATIGFRYGQWKVEGSSFTGREPNEKRFDFDKPRFDSWSSRLSYNPSKSWALQVSHGYLKSPEEIHPNENVNRTTASISYSLPLADNKWVNAIGLWGMNKTKENAPENAILVEGSFHKNKWSIYSRYEFIEKSAEELNLEETSFDHSTIFPVNALTLGSTYDIVDFGNIRLAGGSQLTYYSADKRLDSLYGKNPMAFQVYLRIYPTIMKL